MRYSIESITDLYENRVLELKYLFNVNRPSEWSDEIIFQYGIHLGDNQYYYRAPGDGYVKSGQNGIIKFTDFRLPCIKGTSLSLEIIDEDMFTKDDKSQRLMTSCETAGQLVVHKFHIQSDSSKGRYTLYGEMQKDVRSNHGSLSSFNPGSIYNNRPEYDKTSTNALKLNNIVNPFQINDNNDVDEISISILSDTLG